MFDSIGVHNAKRVQDVKKDFTLYVQYLLEREPRIRLHAFADDIVKSKFFFVTKDYIHIPWQFPRIEHEIAHAVEMKDEKRWLLPDWGLAVDSFTGKKDPKPSLMFAAMSREIRVRAIQLHMYPAKPKDNSTLKNILNNDIWRNWAETMIPFGRFKNYQDVCDWVNDLGEKSYKAWDLDRISYEWDIRLTAMRNWMETKQAA